MKKFNSYLIDDVKSESEVQVLMEMTELLLKQYEMSNYYYMEDVEPPKDSKLVTTPQPAAAAAAKTTTPTPTTKPNTPTKTTTGDLTSNPSANNTNTPNQQQKPEEQKGFIGFIKKIGNAISGWVKKIIDFITGGKKKSDEVTNEIDNALVQAKEAVGNDEQSKEKLEELGSSNKLDEFLKKLGFNNIDFEKIKNTAIAAIISGTITSIISKELLIMVESLLIIDTAVKHGEQLSVFDKARWIGIYHADSWMNSFKSKLNEVINFVKNSKNEVALDIQQFKDLFSKIMEKLKSLKPTMEKVQKETQEEIEILNGEVITNEAYILEMDPAVSQQNSDNMTNAAGELKETLETCKKTFWLITFIQNIGEALLKLIQHIGDLFKKDKPELHDEDESNILGADQQQSQSAPQDIDYSAMVEKDETYQPPENPQVSAPPTNAPENPQINTTDNVSQQSQSAPQSENQQATSQTIPASTELPPEQEEKYQQQLNQIADKENAQKEVFAQLNAGKLSSEIDSQLLEKAGIPQSMLDNLDASASMSRSLEQRNRELQNQLRGGSARQ